jgi:hypothetical protein
VSLEILLEMTVEEYVFFSTFSFWLVVELEHLKTKTRFKRREVYECEG